MIGNKIVLHGQQNHRTSLHRSRETCLDTVAVREKHELIRESFPVPAQQSITVYCIICIISKQCHLLNELVPSHVHSLISHATIV